MADYLALNSVVCTESEAPPPTRTLPPTDDTTALFSFYKHKQECCPTGKTINSAQMNYKGQSALLMLLSTLSD